MPFVWHISYTMLGALLPININTWKTTCRFFCSYIVVVEPDLLEIYRAFYYSLKTGKRTPLIRMQDILMLM